MLLLKEIIQKFSSWLNPLSLSLFLKSLTKSLLEYLYSRILYRALLCTKFFPYNLFALCLCIPNSYNFVSHSYYISHTHRYTHICTHTHGARDIHILHTIMYPQPHPNNLSYSGLVWYLTIIHPTAWLTWPSLHLLFHLFPIFLLISPFFLILIISPITSPVKSWISSLPNFCISTGAQLL